MKRYFARSTAAGRRGVPAQRSGGRSGRHPRAGRSKRPAAGRRRATLGWASRRNTAGLGADEATRREYTELMASACGVTAFVQQQLHAGGGFVGGGRSEALETRNAAALRVGAGALRRGVLAPAPARPADGDGRARPRRLPRINGKAPWVTGWGLLDSFILGACGCPKTTTSIAMSRKPATKPPCCPARASRWS